jgi:hypothetical protein
MPGITFTKAPSQERVVVEPAKSASAQDAEAPIHF